MRRLSVAVLAVLALAACSESPADSRVDSGALRPRFAASAAPEQVMPGEVLVKPQEGVDVAAVAAAHGLAVAARGYRDAFFVLRGAIGSERANAARLRQDARLVYAEPNFLRQPTVDSRLWAFYNPGGLNMKFTSGSSSGQFIPSSYASKNDADEDADGSDITAGYGATGDNVVIGSIDTGVDFTHPEFTGRLIAGQDWYSGDADPSDTDGHGTHTTGTMAGSTVGVAGVAGAAAHVKVYVQRVCGQRGCPTSAIVSAIRAAADQGVVAMNLSLGGSSESQAEQDAIAYATQHDALVIASAGNDGTGTVSCPACDANAISVAATNWKDSLASYSNWGSGLDIAAPGGQCYSNTTPEGCIYSAYKGGGYAWLQGTSMAAPQVTGTAAVVASHLGLRGSALRTQLTSTADNIGSSTFYGSGRLNTYRAVTNGTPVGGGGGGGGGGGTLTASFSYGCSQATCSFDGSSSTGAVSYAWNFGDGGSATGATASHTYGSAGSFAVVLTVQDAASNTAQSAPQTVSCSLKGKSLKCH
ncbi:MAG TPA: S8 family serine peptidase [Longimicrobiales bacterium]|nr:S8 family serine peptidase [Longimicrobiales bacterium]